MQLLWTRNCPYPAVLFQFRGAFLPKNVESHSVVGSSDHSQRPGCSTCQTLVAALFAASWPHMATSLSLKILPAASLGVWWLLTGRLRVSCYLAEVGSDWRLRVPTFPYFSMSLFAFLGGRITCILFVSELCTLLVYSCVLHVTIRDSDVVPWFGDRLPVLRLTEGSLATLRRQSEFIDNDVIATSLGWWLVRDSKRKHPQWPYFRLVNDYKIL